jgi:hypothetical protein
MNHRSVAGLIRYTSRKSDRYGAERGHERFLFTHHAGGAVVLRAHCEIEEPAPSVMRDVVYALDANRRPMDCTIRLVVGDEFMGSGWFRFGEDFIECESYGPAIGRLSQRVTFDTPIDGFGTHPVVADGFMLAGLPWQPGQRRTVHCYLPSPDHRGATPPMLAKVDIDACYLGTEPVTVAAGRFTARHFQFLDDGASGMAGQHPPYDVWITDDADAVMLQGGVGGYMQTWYELIELQR